MSLPERSGPLYSMVESVLHQLSAMWYTTTHAMWYLYLFVYCHYAFFIFIACSARIAEKEHVMPICIIIVYLMVSLSTSKHAHHSVLHKDKPDRCKKIRQLRTSGPKTRHCGADGLALLISFVITLTFAPFFIL